MDVDVEAVGLYETGLFLDCANRIASFLPRTEARNLLMLFASIGRIGFEDLLQQIEPYVSVRIDQGLADDPVNRLAFAVILGKISPTEAAAHAEYRAATVQYWSAQRLAATGEHELARRCLRTCVSEAEPGLENYLARKELASLSPVRSGVPTAADLALLRVRVLRGLILAPLLPAAADELIRIGHETNRPEFAAEGFLTRAACHADDGAWVSCIGAITDARELLIQAGPATVGHALSLSVAALGHMSDTTEALRIVDELLASLVRMHPTRELARAAAMFLISPETSSLVEQSRLLLRFVVESGCLTYATGEELSYFVARALHEEPDLAGRIDDTVNEISIADPLTRIEAALTAYRANQLHASGGAERLTRVGRHLFDGGPVDGTLAGPLLALSRALRMAGEAALAGDLLRALLSSPAIPDYGEEQALITAELSATVFALGERREAQSVLDDFIGGLDVALEVSSVPRELALLAAARLGFELHSWEYAVAPLYELRYRLEQHADPPVDLCAEVAKRIGMIQMVLGGPGAALRYFWEPLRRPELAAMSPHAKEELTRGLEIAEARRNSDSDQAFRARLTQILVSGDEDAPNNGKSSSLAEDAELDALTDELVAARSEGQSADSRQLLYASVKFIEGKSGRGTYLHTSAQFRLALSLAADGDFDSAWPVWCASCDAMVRHLAGLAAVAPVEDLREVSALLSRHLETGVVIAEQLGRAQREEAAFRLVLGRSLWTDLRVIRRDLGADGASQDCARRIASRRRKIARLRFDGPEPRDRENPDIEYYPRLIALRLERDLLELEALSGKADPASMVDALDRARDRSLQVLAKGAVFVGFYRFERPMVFDVGLKAQIRSRDPEQYLGILAFDGHWSTFALGNTEEFDELVASIPKGLRDEAFVPGRPSARLGSANLLRNRLLELIPSDVSSRGQISVCAEGALSEVPWPLLWPQGVAGAQVQNVQTFRSIGRSKPKSVRLNPHALVVGRPDYGRAEVTDSRSGGVREFRDLPTTQVEAEIVAEFCGAVPLVGRSATVDAVLSSAPSGVAHIASHGYYLRSAGGDEMNESFTDITGAEMHAAREHLTLGPLIGERIGDPLLRAGIALAGVNEWLSDDGRGSRDFGIVTAEDLSWACLGDVDCVILSACVSGLGQGSRSAGSRGMRLGAILGGAKWVISSLWPVPDVPTAILMELLYRHLQSRDEPTIALARAQHDLRTADYERLLKTRTLSGLLELGPEQTPRRYVETVLRARGRDHPPFAHPYFWSGFITSC